MSKIRISHNAFKHLNQPLGKRQPGGAMPKRLTEGINASAIRLLKREPFRLGGIVGAHARRGFETVSDLGVEKSRIYCRICGTMVKDESLDHCVICRSDFTCELVNRLTFDKFDCKCLDCGKPHHVKEKIKTDNNKDTFILKRAKTGETRYDVRFDAKKVSHQTGFNSLLGGIKSEIESIQDLREMDAEYQVCKCFVEARQKRAADLRRDRNARKIALQVKSRARKDVILTALTVEKRDLLCKVAELTEAIQATKLRFNKKQFFFQRSALLKRISEIDSILKK